MAGPNDDTTYVPGLVEGDDELTGVVRPDVPVDDVDVEEEVEVFVSSLERPPLTGAYAPIANQTERAWASASLPDEEPPGPLFDPLPEMSAEIWQAGVRGLVNVPETIEPPPPDEAYWRDLGGLLVDELGVTEEPGARAELMLSAARVAEWLADGPMALRLVDDALAAAPAAPDAWRARARLLEGVGDFDGAHEAWRQLRARAAEDELEAYTALDGEWTLARRGALDGLEGPSLGAVPDGPARALAEAEIALLRGTPAEVAAALEQAAFGAGGAAGAALLEAAARFHEVGGDAAAAAEQRFVAARMDAGSAAPPLGRLRDAARLPPDEAEAALAALRAELVPSALSAAVARWAASLARTRGDAALAFEILAGVGGTPLSAALLRDRIDLALELGAPFDAETRAAAMAHADTPVAFALASLREATSAALAGDAVTSLDRLAEGSAALPEALPLGLLAEDLSRADVEAAARERALEIWLGADPARRGPAALALADAIDARGDAGAELAARAALQTALEAAPGAATFWAIAARDARAGRIGDAAATLTFGAENWAGSRLGAALSERAAELAALAAPGAALPQLHGLATPGPAELERLLTIARTVVRDTPSADQHAWLTDQVGVFTDLQTRAAWWLRRAQALPPGTGDERASCLDAALDKAPAHPVALALLLGDPDVSAAHAATALATAAATADLPAFRYAAAQLAALADARGVARDLAAELVTAVPAPAAVELMVELARLAGGAAAAAGFVARLAPQTGDLAQTLRISEALETLGETARAAAALDRLASGPLAADARRAMARLEGRSPGAGLPLEAFAMPDDGDAERATEALARLRRAAEQGRVGDVVWALENEPPADSEPRPDTLFFAGLVGAAEPRAAALFGRAFVEGAPGRFAWALRVAETASDAALVARALERAAAAVGARGQGDPSAATFLRAAAAAHARVGDDAASLRCLRGAVAADPEHLPSLMALRRASAHARELGATVEACAWEARVVREPATRVTGLLRAAELARFEAPPPDGQGPTRALDLYREALELEPANEAAFGGLRALLESSADHAALAAALAARIVVARNPFEITALRLARVELLAGPLAERDGAKAELQTILHKEPQHARALARLSDLEFDDGDFAAAGELYLRRALVERAPDVLRETLLRLGRIYTRHVPDAKRAIGAYARVLQTEADNHEALAALSELYLETGDAKNALVVTEALVAREPEPARRLAALVRCGQLHERTGDLRQAGARFRQAVDGAPRDLAAVTELARFLERTRDLAGRRALLDHAVGLLRHDVERGRFDATTLRTLVPLLQARSRTRSAAAAAQLLAAFSGDDGSAQVAVKTWAAPPPRGRRLAALARPELDERSFPPALLPGMRHVFRLVGPLLAKGVADVARHGLARGERLARGQAVRDIADGVAVELGVADVDVYVRTAQAKGVTGAPVHVEPGDRPALVVGAEVLALGGHALRFAAARGLRLVATHLDLVLAGTPEQAGALLGGVIRQFVPEFKHAEVRDSLLDAEAERVARLMPRKLKPEVMPFAVESAGAFSLEALHAAVRDGANAAGLLACGDLAAALAVVVAGTGRTLAAADLAGHGEALALLCFALSDDYDEMAEAME